MKVLAEGMTVECITVPQQDYDKLTAERDKYKTALERIALESSSSGGDLWEIHEVATDALE